MKKIIERIGKIDNLLEKVSIREDAYDDAEHYYKTFGKPGEKEKDMEFIAYAKKRLLSAKYSALESLQIKINLEKCDINTELRELNNLKSLNNE